MFSVKTNCGTLILLLLCAIYFNHLISLIINVGERSHLSRISFCVNASATAPPSPIPTSLPIRVYPKDKGWLSTMVLIKAMQKYSLQHRNPDICLETTASIRFRHYTELDRRQSCRR